LRVRTGIPLGAEEAAEEALLIPRELDLTEVMVEKLGVVEAAEEAVRLLEA
jgi:hypothetical protein